MTPTVKKYESFIHFCFAKQFCHLLPMQLYSISLFNKIRLVEFLNPKNSLFHHFAPPASSKARIYLQKSLFPCYFRPMYVCGVNVNFRTYFKKYDGGTWSTRRLFQGSLMYLISELRAFPFSTFN